MRIEQPASALNK